jgi:hypothetical protein
MTVVKKTTYLRTFTAYKKPFTKVKQQWRHFHDGGEKKQPVCVLSLSSRSPSPR